MSELPTEQVYHRHTAHEFAREWLREAIIIGKLAEGTRLVQANIAEQLAVSTTPVREALRDLAAEGLVDLDAHRGAIVHEISTDEFQEIYTLREHLEPLAARLAAERITDAELARAADLLGHMDEEEAADKNTAVWTELNRQFHATLTDAARSPRLQGMLRSLRDSSTMYIAFIRRQPLDGLEAANKEHRRIFEAMTARDPDAAAEATLSHLQSTISHLDLMDGTDNVADAQD